MEINVSELPFRNPRVGPPTPLEHSVICLADPADLTVCLNSEGQLGEVWERSGSVELRCEAFLVHETLHVLLRKIEEQEADTKLDGSHHQPIDNWINDYAISRPVGVTYPDHRGFWRKDG